LFIEKGTTKSRSLEAPSFRFLGKWRDPSSPTNPWFVESDTRASLGGTQITESDGNRWPLPKKGDFHDYGSEFFSIKKEVVNSKFNHAIFFRKPVPGHGPAEHMLDGPHIANCFETINTGNEYGKLKLPLKYAFPPDLSSSRESLVQKGTLAISLCQPTNQIANAATFMGELMQDVPSIPGVHLWESRLRAAEVLARSSGEFLNVVFGILPTIGDMDKFLKGVHKIDRAVDQFIRDSGRMVRRQFHFPKETTTTIVDLVTDTNEPRYSPVGQEFIWNSPTNNYMFHLLSPNLGVGFPSWNTNRKRTVEREIWFSGAFTYHLPDGYDSHSKGDRRRLMAQLFGARPDLNTLWQLSPWSWAVDWFSDAGDFISNLQAHISYGSVMRYGYMMETTTITDTFYAGRARTEFPRDYGAFPDPFPTPSPVILRTTVKKRIKANPFGFGIGWEGLSPLQLAIAAALGISRVAR